MIERILNPSSKRSSIQELNRFYNADFDFSLDDIYRFLSHLSKGTERLQAHLRKEVDKIFKQDTSRIYYDVTNYYFEIDYNDSIDNYRHRGVSKERKVDPIIGFSLFIDSKGLPIKFNIFNGNTSESVTLIPELKKLKKEFNVNRTVVVADKGLNTSKNIAELTNNGDGYLFSQILRGKKGKRYHEHILNDTDLIKTFNENNEVQYKYKIFTEEYESVVNGKKQTLTRKVLIYYNLKDDLKMKAKRFEQILKAQKSLGNNAYDIDHSYAKYISKEIVDKETGEIYENYTLLKNLDLEKISEDELFDGYFCLITSELNYDHATMRETYHKLSEIEETFKITKTNLRFRPVFHFKKENITSHFLICYTALLIIRLLQFKLKNESINLSIERIVRILNNMNMEIIKDIVHLHHVGGKLDFKSFEKNNKISFSNGFDGDDQLEKDYKLLKISFGTPFDYAYSRVEKFNRYFKSINFHTTTT